MLGLWGRLSLRLVPWAVLAAVCVVHIQSPSLLQIMRYKVFDFYQQTWPRPASNQPVYVVDVDEKSLKELGQWPWPRTTIARVVETLFETYNIRVLGFDMVFAEPDRTSPENIIHTWQAEETVKSALANLPSHDDVLARTLARYNVVAGQSATHENIVTASAPLAPKQAVSVRGPENALDALVKIERLSRNLPAFEQAAKGIGLFTIQPALDSVVRNVPVVGWVATGQQEKGVQYDMFPTLAVEMLRVGEGYNLLNLYMDKAGATHFVMANQETGQARTLPVDRHGALWPRFRHTNRDHYVSAVDVVEGRLPKDALEGGYVLLGTSAIGLFDLRSTPTAAIAPGVDLHMQLLESILEEDYLFRTQDTLIYEQLFLLVMGIAMILLVEFAGALWSAVAACMSVVAAVGVSVTLFRHSGYLIDALFPTLSLILIFMVQNVIKYMREESSRKAIRSAFAHYLSPDMVKILAQAPGKLKLGGEEKEMTVLFSDIRGFTTLSENFTPEELSTFLNEYLTPMSELVKEKSGTIDKYMGDAVMAFWNAPLDVPDHPTKACESALAMLRKLDVLNATWAKRGLPAIHIGIGLNTSSMSVGNMGSATRFDYTVMGDGVNLGARLESACKTYGVSILVSEAVKERVPEGVFIPIDRVTVKGKTEPVEIYELAGLGDEKIGNVEEDLEPIRHMIEAYRAQDWKNALNALSRIQSHPVLKELYKQRINAFQQTPPPASWDGVFVATAK